LLLLLFVLPCLLFDFIFGDGFILA
jgi:hypothetical protein